MRARKQEEAVRQGRRPGLVVSVQGDVQLTPIARPSTRLRQRTAAADLAEEEHAQEEDRGKGWDKGKGKGSTATRRAETLPDTPPARAWQTLEDTNVAAELVLRVSTIQNVPNFFRGRWRFAYTRALEELVKVKSAEEAGGDNLEARWELFLLLPRMLLRRSHLDGAAGKEEFNRRYQLFLKGK